MTEASRKRLYMAAVILFLAFCILVGRFVGVPMVRMAEDPAAFQKWVDGFGLWGRLIFIAMVFLQVVVALIPGEPIELVAGYTFGFWEGTALALVGILLGSWAVFALVRRFGPKFAQVFFPQKELKRLAFLKDPKKSGILAFVLMTIPGTPKDLLSYFAGLTPLKTRQWLGIVAVSRIPSLATSTLSGALAGKENYILSAAVFAFTLIISAIGILYYRKICKTQEKEQSPG